MAKVKPYKLNSDEWDDEDEVTPVRRKKKKKAKKEKPKKKKGNPLRGLFSFIFFVLLGCVIWQAPTIISETGLHHKITAAFLSDCPGSVHTESVVLDWKKPILIKNVQYKNQEGQPLLNIEEISSDRNLIDFVIDFWHPGTFTITKPVIIVKADDDRTNWDYTLKKWSETDPSNSSHSDWQFPVTVKIQDGSVELHNESDSNTLISDIQASMMIPEETSKNASLDWDSQIGMNGRLQASMNASSNISKKGTLEFQLKEIELEPFREILNSLVKNRELSGMLSGDILVNWENVNEIMESTVKTDFKIQEIIIDLPDHLEESIQLSEVALSSLATVNNSTLVIEKLDFNSEPVQINSEGKFELADLNNLQTKSQLFKLAGKSEYSVETDFDIAKISRLLPQTIKLHNNVSVESGIVHCTLNNQMQSEDQNFVLNIKSSELVAERDSKVYRWEDPIQIEIMAHAENDILVVDQVDCDSDFLTIQTTKNNKNLGVNLKCNLDQLANRLDAIVDFSEARLKGQLKGNINYQPIDDNRYQVAGEMSVKEFELQWNNQSAWIEENLTCNFEGNGEISKSIEQMIESGQLSIISGEDVLNVRTENDLYQENYSPTFNIVVKGDLKRWKNRVTPFYNLDEWDIKGSIDGKTKVRLKNKEIVFTEGYAFFKPLNIQGPSVNIQQKRAKIETEGTWLLGENRLVTPKSKWNSDSLALSLVDFDINFTQDQLPKMDGELSFKGSFPKLLSWVQNPNSANDLQYRGVVSSQISFSNSNSMTRMNGDVYLDRFIAYGKESEWNPQSQSRSLAWKPVWKEKQIALKTDIFYDEISDQMTIRQCDLSSNAVLASISGKVEDFMTSRVAALDGSFDYDFPKLLARLDPSISKNIQIVGKRQSSFSIAGSMNSRHRIAVSPKRSSSSIVKPLFRNVSNTNQDWPDQFVMRAGMGWQSAEIYGLNVGSGDVGATLQNQTIDFGTVELDVNRGRVTLHPKINFQQSPSILSIGTGRVIQGVEITREVCQSWMKFVTPTFADSANVEGIFSLDLHHADMPLGKLKNSDVKGTLLIHNAQAEQGPMAVKMVSMINQLMTILNRKNSRTVNEFQETSIKFPKQKVPFMMQNGKVMHRNLTMIVNDVKIRTSGTVNEDQSINLVAEIPVAPDWVDNNKYFQSMSGKTLKIPITGTLALPQIDQRVFSMISQQAIQGSAKELINNQIQNQMNKIFKKIK